MHQHHHAAEHRGKLRGRAALVIDGGAREGRGAGRHAEKSGGDVARAHADQFLVGSRRWPLRAARDLVMAVASSMPMMAMAMAVLIRCGRISACSGQGRQVAQRRQNRGQGAFILDQAERQVRVENGENPRRDAQKRQADQGLRPFRPPAFDALKNGQRQQRNPDGPPGKNARAR